MKIKSYTVIFLTLVLLMSVPVHGEEIGNGAAVLKMIPSAKGTALGNSLAADNSFDAVFYNPAGIATIALFENIGVGMSYSSISKQSLMQSAFLGYYELKNVGVFGLSVLYNDNGDIPLVTLNEDESVTDTGTSFGAMDMAGRLAYARTFLEGRLLTGISFSFVYSKIESYSATGYGADIGIQYLNLIQDLVIGLSVKNLGTGLKYISKTSDFPLTVNFGLKYIFIDATLIPDHYLAAYLQGDMVLNEKTNGFSAGLEYGFMKVIYLRAGYRAEKDNLFSFSFGAGFKYQFLKLKPELDISFLPQSDFGNKLYVNLMVNF
ncbi:MAG: PorV/PorQ family protein [bacterium]|nr:PorV/PorQ family protein [bacterium]